LTQEARQSTSDWKQACTHLRRADPVLCKIIDAHSGAMLEPRHDAFFSLARSIVGQQISVKAAASVWGRFEAEVQEVTPHAVAGKASDTLRACGLSNAKARYILSLAEHFIDGSLRLSSWSEMDDEAVIDDLTKVKGIGRWTAEMFLIFHLLSADVLPLGDLGLQRAIGDHYLAGERPTNDQMLEVAARWRPWRSIATWYLWRSLDAVPVNY